jgi:hypothetical protein
LRIVREDLEWFKLVEARIEWADCCEHTTEMMDFIKSGIFLEQL